MVLAEDGIFLMTVEDVARCDEREAGESFRPLKMVLLHSSNAKKAYNVRRGTAEFETKTVGIKAKRLSCQLELILPT